MVGLPVLEGDHLIPGAGQVRIARWWSAILSFLTVALTFVVGFRIRGTESGLLASLIVAASTLAVREAHFGKADSAAAFAGVVFLLACTDSVVRGTLRPVLVGAAIGYAVSNKASIGLLLPTAYLFLRSYDDSSWRLRWRPLLTGAAVSAFTVLMLNPHWLTNTAEAFSVARATVGKVTYNSWLAGSDEALPPLQYHFGISLRYGCGAALTWAAIPALLYGLYRGPATRLVALYLLGPLAVFLSSPMVIARFMLPLVPGLALLVAVAVVDAVRLLPVRARVVALVFAAVTFSAEPLARSAAIVQLLGTRDTRLLASDWFEANVPREAVVVSWGTPPRVHADWGGIPRGGRPTHRNLSPEKWETENVRYVVWHSYPLAYSSLPPPPELEAMVPVAVFDPWTGPGDRPVLEPMDAFYLPLARLDGLERPGPRIAIYRVEPH